MKMKNKESPFLFTPPSLSTYPTQFLFVCIYIPPPKKKNPLKICLFDSCYVVVTQNVKEREWEGKLDEVEGNKELIVLLSENCQ